MNDLNVCLSKGNAKLRKTAFRHNFKLLGFDLPAGKTCPHAGECKKICYAKKGRFTFINKIRANARNYLASISGDFVQYMTARIQHESKHTRRDHVCIRIHASGDFYSADYANKWRVIAENCPDVTFYAYTKSVSIVKNIAWPSNVFIAYSTGGTQDLEIPEGATVASIFDTAEQAIANGFDPAINDDDLLVCQRGARLGLVKH